MVLTFEWDRVKEESNRKKHDVSFAEAATVFGDPLSISIPDPMHSESEHRFVPVGASVRGRLLVVTHAERGNNIRIIGARLAMRRERRTYEED